MGVEWVATILQAVIGGMITGAAAYAAIKVEIRWLRSDLNKLERLAQQAHNRIDEIFKRA